MDFCLTSTFNESNIYYMIEYGPIREKTIYVLDPKSGAIKSGWGEDLFYMPHGMTIDVHGNYWITDVAMHQVFKVTIADIIIRFTRSYYNCCIYKCM